MTIPKLYTQEFYKWAYFECYHKAKLYPKEREMWLGIAWLIQRDDLTSESFVDVRKVQMGLK